MNFWYSKVLRKYVLRNMLVCVWCECVQPPHSCIVLIHEMLTNLNMAHKKTGSSCLEQPKQLIATFHSRAKWLPFLLSVVLFCDFANYKYTVRINMLIVVYIILYTVTQDHLAPTVYSRFGWIWMSAYGHNVNKFQENVDNINPTVFLYLYFV